MIHFAYLFEFVCLFVCFLFICEFSCRRISRAHHQLDVVTAYVNQFIGWLGDARFFGSTFETRLGVPRADVVFSAYDLGEHTNFAPAANVRLEFEKRKGVTVVPWDEGMLLFLFVCVFIIVIF
jgi:hypothetical protein